MRAFENAGLTLNADKCKIKQKKVVFFGLSFSEEVIQLCESKTAAIQLAESPQNAKELHSFAGLITYAAKLIPNDSSLMHPFRALLKKNAVWRWAEEPKRH